MNQTLPQHAMKPWLVRVQVKDKQAMWAGDFEAQGRNEAKRAARLFVSAHFPMDTMILGIRRGYITVTFEGEEIPVNELCGEEGVAA